MRVARSQFIASIGFGAVLAGSFLPWAQVGTIELGGYDRHGGVTAAVCVVGLYLLMTCKAAMPIAIASGGALLTACIGLYNAMHPMQLRMEIQAHEMGILVDPTVPGLGLYVVTGGGILASLGGWQFGRSLSIRAALSRPMLRRRSTRCPD